MSTKSGQFVYLDDGTVAQQVQIAGTDSQSTGALGVNVKQSDAIVPVDIQNRLASTIQTHAGVAVAGSGSASQASYMDCDGFDKVAITLLNDASLASSANILWSNDGTTNHGSETVIVSGPTSIKAGVTDIKARYAKVQVVNGDTAVHTMSAWAYLKA